MWRHLPSSLYIYSLVGSSPRPSKVLAIRHPEVHGKIYNNFTVNLEGLGGGGADESDAGEDEDEEGPEVGEASGGGVS